MDQAIQFALKKVKEQNVKGKAVTKFILNIVTECMGADSHIAAEKMKIRLNEDKEVVAQIREGLKMKGGYCPCRLERTEENKCMCKEFKDQIADPNFEGYCHCMLYYKSLDD